MTAGAEGARGQYLAADTVIDLGEDLEVDDAVVDEDDVPLVDVIDQAVVIDVHRVYFLATGPANGELHNVTDLKVEFRG